MEIRAATHEDIPEIVALLKLSLGESLTPKSERYWRWKHLDNPFGASPVLLAFEQHLLVGVRAFMRWRWQCGDRVFHAVRAVDTATHPDHQGKGIFKKLTLSLVDQCKGEGIGFVFNTPNNNSKPGYLKMGWTEAGKMPLSIMIRRPVSMVFRAAGLISEQSGAPSHGENSLQHFLELPALPDLLKEDNQRQTSICTLHSLESLRWRYQHVGIAKYFAVCVERGTRLVAMVVYRIKSGRAGSEFRIADIFLQSTDYKKEVATLVKERAKLHNADFITVFAKDRWILDGIFTVAGVRVGPVVTVRDLAGGPMDKLLGFQQWSPSLGDLELF